MSSLCEHIRQRSGQIVSEWRAETNVPPWNQLSEGEWHDHLPPLLKALLDSTICGSRTPEARHRLVQEAATHGEHRRVLGFTHELLLQEYYALRNALWRILRDAAETRQLTGEILRVDAAISVVTIAAFRGYHREEFERAGRWPDCLAEVADQWERVIRH